MRAGHLDNVKKKRDRDTLLFEVDGYGYQRLMVRGSPSIGCKVQCAIMFLLVCLNLKHFAEKN
jgi:hypothetical protein